VWGSTFTQDVLSLGQTIWIVFLVAVVLLVVASTLLIANTIRLSIFSRRREIETIVRSLTTIGELHRALALQDWLDKDEEAVREEARVDREFRGVVAGRIGLGKCGGRGHREEGRRDGHQVGQEQRDEADRTDDRERDAERQLQPLGLAERHISIEAGWSVNSDQSGLQNRLPAVGDRDRR